MSSAGDVIYRPDKRSFSWGLWLRQIRAIVGLELAKNFLSRRSILIYLIALLPLLPLTVLIFVPKNSEELSFNNIGKIYALLYYTLILRTVIFFGCAWIFMNLFRGELVDRSLHYYFLSPVRREVLVAGKYLSGLVTSIILFTSTTVIAMLMLYFGLFPAESGAYFFGGAGAGQMLSYLGVTILACIGYGAVFLIVGLRFRNPIIPGLL